jgi:hypothetical protein
MTWQNRIVGFSEVDPSELAAHPDNWRVHTMQQRSALEGILEEVGVVQTVVVNRRNNRIIDGHLRVRLAIERGEPRIPVTWVDLDEEEERKILLTFDNIARLASVDPERVRALVEKVRFESRGLLDLVDRIRLQFNIAADRASEAAASAAQSAAPDLSKAAGDGSSSAAMTSPDVAERVYAAGGPGSSGLEHVSDNLGVFKLDPAMLFPSNLPFGIPPLRPDRILEIPERLSVWPGDASAHEAGDPPYLLVYNTSCHKLDLSQAIFCLYTWDVDLEGFWLHPDRWAARFINARLMGVIMPNFSMYEEAPLAIQIWQRYRAMWIARFWQEAGIKIIPDIEFGTWDTIEWCLAGIPTGAHVAMQLQVVAPHDEDWMQRLRTVLDKLQNEVKPERMLFYAGARGRALIETLNLRVPYVVVPTRMDVFYEKRISRKRI